MTVLSTQGLFGDLGLPLRVIDATAVAPSGSVTAEAVKVVFTVSGWAEIRTAEDVSVISPGTILMIPANLECLGFPTGHARTVTFYIDRDYVADQVRWLTSAHPMVHQLKRSLADDAGLQCLQVPPSAMHHLTPSLARLAHIEPDAQSEFAKLSLASEILGTVERFVGFSERGLATDTISIRPRREVACAIDLMRSRVDHAWRCEELARAVSLSTSQLNRVFRVHTGLSPAAYLTRLRVDRMAELLMSTDLGVSEVAREVGWMNATVASRCFKRRYGASPREFAAFSRRQTTTISPPLQEA